MPITISDVMIAASTLASPVIALTVQRVMDDRRIKKDRQLAVFRTLMATRATNLAPDHVAAVNAVPIDFYGNKDILDKWQEYYDHLSREDLSMEAWALRRIDLMNSLLSSIGRYLNYKFSPSDIQKIYYPKGHGSIEKAQTTVLDKLASFLSGDTAVKMEVTKLPGTGE
ncbi:DUF6680 family protein [Hyphomicrobium sp.]|uniref:DUF6680 family protein n=1 Tax=Hyphomicrobium sp. TaxID=82 RepID=UPI000FA8640B|nr:DUF6680 family protein [Hyphomicrobium sp.]RUP00114.1 MAG: hypothetical protein EKK30_03090 [Hyphomicrobium sp.]